MDFGSRLKHLSDSFEKVISNGQVPAFAQAGIKQIKDHLEGFVKEYVSEAMKAKPTLKVRKLAHFKGELPAYETSGASGMDLRAAIDESISIEPGARFLVPTGLSFEIPLGFEMQIRPRSGLAIKKGISMVNSPGTVDADYRGEVKIIVINHGSETFLIEDQDRIAQAVIAPVVQPNLVEVVELEETERGEGGFGSTGV